MASPFYLFRSLECFSTKFLTFLQKDTNILYVILLCSYERLTYTFSLFSCSGQFCYQGYKVHKISWGGFFLLFYSLNKFCVSLDSSASWMWERTHLWNHLVVRFGVRNMVAFYLLVYCFEVYRFIQLSISSAVTFVKLCFPGYCPFCLRFQIIVIKHVYGNNIFGKIYNFTEVTLFKIN